MTIYTNFKIYTPESLENPELNIGYLMSDEGVDWYESQAKFAEETLKIAYNFRGIIRSYDQDVSRLWPVNLSVSEVKASAIPEGFNLSSAWVFDGKKIVPFEYTDAELRDRAENKRADLLSAANDKIIPLQARLSVGRQLTDEQLKTLNALLDFIDELEACDPMEDAFVWPEVPGDVA